MNQKHEIYLEPVAESGETVQNLEPGDQAFITLHTRREPLIIREGNFRGENIISIRFHYYDKRDGVLRPGKRGANFPREAARLVADAIYTILGIEILETQPINFED